MAVPDGTKVSSSWWGGTEKTVGTTFGEWENVTVGGVNYSGPHTGMDIPMPTGTTLTTPVHAVVEGAGTDAVGNNYVRLKLDSGVSVLMLHLQDVLVHAGQDLSPGAQVGTSGSSGLSTGPHLHFEVDQGDTPIDPWNVLTMAATSVSSPQGGGLFDLSSVANPLQTIADAFSTEGKILSFITDKRNWYKTGFVVIGVGLIAVGVFIYFFQEEKTIVIQMSNTAEKVAPAAAAAA